MEPRECGECDLCCNLLKHNVYGQDVTPDNPCRFSKNGRCSIYSNRPAHCIRYQCMWLEGFLPEWMYPKDIGVVITVRSWPQGKWVEVGNAGGEITQEIFAELVKFNVPFIYNLEGQGYFHGSSEFEEFYKHYSHGV